MAQSLGLEPPDTEMPQPQPSLAAFERHVAARNVDAAVEEALRLLRSIDEGMGSLTGINFGVPFPDVTLKDLHIRFATRFAAAFGDLLTLPNVKISAAAVELLFIYHRWSDMMFSLSGFQTSAHLLARLTNADAQQWKVTGSALVQFLVIFSPSSTLEINLDECYAANPSATVVAALGYLSVRICITPRAGAFRERLLEWLPGKLADVTLGRIRLASTAEVYMHCSYAFGAGKHQIKADLIAQMRKVCLAAGAREMTGPPPKRKKPRIVVLAEHFRAGHSVFRTHSRAVRSLRERFEVIGVGYEERTDDDARACFDGMIFYPRKELIESAAETANAIVDLKPDILFHLGVGMSNHVIALASLRLAPIQCVSYGHTATTMSPVIDYVILPDDFVGSEERFSEEVLRLPLEAIPYAAPAPGEPPLPPRTPPAGDSGVLRIAVPASVMKLNAPFLRTLADISARASRPVEFAFFPLAAVGLGHHYLDQEIRRVLPNVVVHSESDRNTYLQRLGACDFFLCPFPYGNMNSIVDAMIMGVPGVCLDGEEAHAHADVAIFHRLGLPPALATSSREAYVGAAVRLIDDADWRAHCRQIAGGIDLGQTFYTGDESKFCEAVYGLLGRA
jgi:hypothetical protein